MHKHGMVNAVVPMSRLMDVAREFAAPILKAAPLAVQATKAVWQQTSHLSAPDAFAKVRRREIPEHVRMMSSDDYLEGPRAFAENRDPVFRGR
jgi:crotonobetainyl-CoA hydratase